MSGETAVISPRRVARGEQSTPCGMSGRAVIAAVAVAPVVHVDHDAPGAAVSHSIDGIERSVIFHALGHAWGVREGDPRSYGEYVLMREAMEASAWRGCLDAG